ncbi:hypothetical protein C1H46_044321 [Malus baccata]|uniref:Uncharacterized protein n=1 Tax=Malus baccata TaxID=106549 RepID=A0A540K7D5_MALBA|nr:hypothetical protein C1H46_044321 [Malus baccata]
MMGDGGDFFCASPSGASGESDEGDMTSAGRGGDFVDLGGDEASARGVGEDLGGGEPFEGCGGEASSGGSDVAGGEAAGGEGWWRC